MLERNHAVDCVECIEGYEWAGGYRRIVRNGRMVYAHRWSYEQAYGPIPDGLEIGHLCHNPKCWEPTHLRAMTHAENMAMRRERQTHCKYGHPLSGDNMTISTGRRRCKTCARERWHRSKPNRALRVALTQLDEWLVRRDA